MPLSRARPRVASSAARATSSAATRSTPSASRAQGPLLLLLHGFPSSSYDWRLLLEEEAERNVLAFDFLGFGLSDKPPDHDYSLFWQADLTEELVRRHGGGRPVFVLAHDMGTSVANELMARDLEGKLEMELAGDPALQRQHGAGAGQPDAGAEGAAQPRRPARRQALQRARLPPPVRLGLLGGAPADRRARGPTSGRWSATTAAAPSATASISYMDQREEHAERWHGAIRDWPGELSLAWGLQDPVATTDVLAALRELRPPVPVTELPELAHYPQLEDPRQMAHVLRGVFPG